MVSGAKNGGYRGVFERKGQRLPTDSRELTVSSVRGGVKVDGAVAVVYIRFHDRVVTPAISIHVCVCPFHIQPCMLCFMCTYFVCTSRHG